MKPLLGDRLLAALAPAPGGAAPTRAPAAGKARPEAGGRRATLSEPRAGSERGRAEARSGCAALEFAALLARLVPHAPSLPPPGLAAAPPAAPAGATRADAGSRAAPVSARRPGAPAKPDSEATPRAASSAHARTERARSGPDDAALAPAAPGATPGALPNEPVDASFLSALREASPAAPASPPGSPEPAVAVALMPRAAHLACQVEGAGDLKLHLRIEDGVAQIRASGEAVPLVAGRADELRVALASAGLQLGNLDLGGERDGDGGRATADELPDRALGAAAARGAARPTHDDPSVPAAPGRLHLKA